MTTFRGNQTTQQQLPKEFHLTLFQEVAANRLLMSHRFAMQRMASDIARSKSVAGVLSRFNILASELPIDITALIQWISRESYLENMEDLAIYAEKVKFFNEQKKQIRDDITSFREVQLNSLGEDGSTQDSSSDRDSIRQQMLRAKDQLTKATRSTSSSSTKRAKK